MSFYEKIIQKMVFKKFIMFRYTYYVSQTVFGTPRTHSLVGKGLLDCRGPALNLRNFYIDICIYCESSYYFLISFLK